MVLEKPLFVKIPNKLEIDPIIIDFKKFLFPVLCSSLNIDT